jgi:hypothetical protein
MKGGVKSEQVYHFWTLGVAHAWGMILSYLDLSKEAGRKFSVAQTPSLLHGLRVQQPTKREAVCSQT